MPDASASNPFRRIVDLFRNHGVEFLVIGGQAEVIFGSPRPTYDVDLCYRRSPDNIHRLAQALRPLKVRLRGAPEGLPFTADARTIDMGCNFTFDTAEGKLDLLGHVEPIGNYDAMLKSAETWRVGDLELKTISLEELIRVKEHIKRDKDNESLVQLRAIKQVRQRSEQR